LWKGTILSWHCRGRPNRTWRWVCHLRDEELVHTADDIWWHHVKRDLRGDQSARHHLAEWLNG
jgi:hypothetical protein